MEATVRASYRKDAYLPDEAYNEYTAYPTTGGRFHLALVSAASGTVTETIIDGFNTSELATASHPPVEWFHVWPHQLVAGEPFFVQFHSKDARWDSRVTGNLRVKTSGGDAFDGSFPVTPAPVPVTYVTTSADYARLFIHVANMDTLPHAATRIVVNARDMTDSTCMPSQAIQPGESALMTVELCTPVEPGDPFTVVVEYADGATATAVGRILPARYPVVTWNQTVDCPYPNANAPNFDKHVAAGIDTLFLKGAPSECSYSQADVVALAASDARFDLVVSDDYGLSRTIPDVSGIAAFMTGDESDGVVYDETDGTALPHKKAAQVSRLWDRYPGVATYNGAKTNGNVGAFAGTDDIQGMDFYVSACAPHITAWGTHPPPRAAYDYLRNARDNHAPLPTWLYSQGLSTVTAWKGQPAPQEILVQGMSVIAAGGKGLMWFQSSMIKASSHPDSWNAMATVGRTVRGVRHLLREGDITGMATTTEGAIVEMIRSPDALVVPVINVTSTDGPTDVLCGIYLAKPWTFAATTPTVDVKVPVDFEVSEIFEVGPQGPVDFGEYSVAGRTVTLGPIGLDNAAPARLFVLARDASVRADVAAAMAY